MKIFFVVSEDWYFCSHRLPLAEEALKKGWEVCLLGRLSGCEAELNEKGIRTIYVDLQRGGLNPARDFKYCRELIHIYKKEKPDIVHHVAMKPCLYGSMAAKCANINYFVNAIAGFGTLFSSNSNVIKLIRPFVMATFRNLFSSRNSRLILQNPDDIKEFEEKLGLNQEKIRLIRGSGVDLNLFHPAADQSAEEIPLIVMVSRLLTDKGVLELIAAAHILKERNITFRIALVGDADALNVHAVSETTLKEAEVAGVAELWGRRTDIAEIYRESDIAVLPSYREGLPKSLIEAAACGLPIVTTNVPGCREVVDDGVNGFLVPVKQAEPLADALEKLITDAELRKKMGLESRKKANAEFGIDLVVEQTFAVYEELLGANGFNLNPAA